MSTRIRKLSNSEISQAFDGKSEAIFPPMLTVQQLNGLLQISEKTFYEWIGKGRLDGAFRKRGKHNLIWRVTRLSKHLRWTGVDQMEQESKGTQVGEFTATYKRRNKSLVAFRYSAADGPTWFSLNPPPTHGSES